MIIAIGGISNAGKSILAERIAGYYKDKSTIILCQDNYANPTSEIPKIAGHTNWEIPESINFDRFYNKIIECAEKYYIVIAEGLFVYYEPRLIELFDKRIYITVDKETFLDRKRKDMRWGKEPEWYIEHIWESHFKFCKKVQTRRDAFQVSGADPVDIDPVIQYLET
jgi:uridine kinase